MAAVTARTMGTFRQSSQRHGSCTKRSSGKNAQRKKLGFSITNAAAPAQTARIHQGAHRGSFLRRDQSDAAASTISGAATNETKRLKRLWSASLMLVKRKLSKGRTPGART